MYIIFMNHSLQNRKNPLKNGISHLIIFNEPKNKWNRIEKIHPDISQHYLILILIIIVSS